MNKKVLMLSTRSPGGISSVVETYKASGLCARWNVRYVSTHLGLTSRGSEHIVALGALGACLLDLVMGRVGLMHVHTASRGSFWRKVLFMMPAFAFRVPVVLHLHGGEFHVFYDREAPRVLRSLVRFVFERAACVIALSDSWRIWLLQRFPNANVRVIHNPVVLRPLPSYETRESGAVLFLGRLGQHKGTFDLIEAAALMRQRGVIFEMWLAGDGALDDASTLAEKLGVASQIRILGWVDSERRNDLLRRASIFVLPSYNEGLPMSVLEAMGAGIPVVTTPVGGIPEAVRDGVQGLLVPPGDRKAIAAAITRLLTDNALRADMGMAGRKTVEAMFSDVAVVPQVEAIYEIFGEACRSAPVPDVKNC
jgi:glycosyltransferase involved in cell wall biosynthesis